MKQENLLSDPMNRRWKRAYAIYIRLSLSQAVEVRSKKWSGETRGRLTKKVFILVEFHERKYKIITKGPHLHCFHYRDFWLMYAELASGGFPSNLQKKIHIFSKQSPKNCFRKHPKNSPKNYPKIVNIGQKICGQRKLWIPIYCLQTRLMIKLWDNL